MPEIVTKICPKCRKTKPAGDFYKDRGRRDGLSGYCKECTVANAKSHYQNNKRSVIERITNWYRSNKDKKKAYDKQRRLEKADELKKTKKQYYEDNKESILRKNREHRKSIPEKMLEYKRKWKKNHKDKVNEGTRTRRARVKGNGGVFTKDEWLEILERYDRKCAKCGSADRIEADHVVPISRGGKNIASNIQPLCRICNASKGNRTEDYR
jgi:5-methylcytosine-specific restriction endonuclease McrA